MTEVMTEHFQASSRGAVGATARSRSTEIDRSRDPLYNQLKMYSEVYRMLGWLRPAGRRLEFTTTILGDQVAVDFWGRPDLLYGLIRQCLLSITFPNPLTNNVGVSNQRPFRWLLSLAAELGGLITRHEMIVGMLAVTDDLRGGALEEAAERILALRGNGRSVLETAVEAYALDSKIQVTTLENYTRLPVGVLKSTEIGWATSVRAVGLYDKPIDALELSGLGSATAEWVANAIDVREADLEGFTLEERAYFANFGHYAMLLRAGLDPSEVDDELRHAEAGCAKVLNELGIELPGDFLYSPVQQASDEVLVAASEID